MTEETKANLPESGIDTQEANSETVVSTTTKDLDTTKNAIIKAYFDKWDKEKGFMVISDLNISTNIFRGTQKKKLLKSLSTTTTTTTPSIQGVLDEEVFQKKAKEAVDKKINELVEKTPAGKFRYEESKMNELKKILSNSESDLTTLKSQIDDGTADLDATLAAGTIVAATAATTTAVTQSSVETAFVISDTSAGDVEEGEIKRKNYIYPLKGWKINSPVGLRTVEGVHGGKEHEHKGIDIAATAGTSILSIADGKVESVGLGSAAGFSGYGNYMVVKLKNGYRVLYGHMSTLAENKDGVKWKKGDKIKAGEQIGLVGNTGTSTGAHLHLEIRKGKFDNDDTNYFSRDYVDPIAVLPVTKDMVNSNIIDRVDEDSLMDVA